MSQPGTPLLDDEGNASMATGVLLTHHGLRRDIALFARALRRRPGSGVAAAALQEEWKAYHQVLHGHHEAEDTRMFPHFKAQLSGLANVIDQLWQQHRLIDPLLERGDVAFSRLSSDHEEAAAVVAQLSTLLDAHLALEEANIVPHLRSMRQFPPPANDEELELYSQGFAWGSRGVATHVLERIDTIVPEAVRAKLPAARVAHEQRCRRAWGDATGSGSSLTSVPDWLLGA